MSCRTSKTTITSEQTISKQYHEERKQQEQTRNVTDSVRYIDSTWVGYYNDTLVIKQKVYVDKWHSDSLATIIFQNTIDSLSAEIEKSKEKTTTIYAIDWKWTLTIAGIFGVILSALIIFLQRKLKLWRW